MLHLNLNPFGNFSILILILQLFVLCALIVVGCNALTSGKELVELSKMLTPTYKTPLNYKITQFFIMAMIFILGLAAIIDIGLIILIAIKTWVI